MQKSIIPKAYRRCSIANNTCYVNGIEYFKGDNNIDDETFLTALYKKTGISYPKFFKMDKLCKLGFLLAELIFKDCDEELKQNTGIYLSNKSSCLLTDQKHQENIQSKNAYFPSPSVFVYTLPNIVIGEISIRHKIMDEGVFFLSENPNFEDLNNYAQFVLESKISQQVLIGWIEAENDKMEADFYLLK